MRTHLLKALGACALAAAFSAAPASAQGPIAPGGDVVTSDNVVHLGSFKQMGDGVGARVLGNILYATSTTGLFVFDISDPAKPKQLGNFTVDVEFENEDVPTNGKILGMSASTFGLNCPSGEEVAGCLNLYDVSDPASIKLISSVTGVSAHTMECVLDCTWFYGSEGQIVDARDPKTAKVIEANWATMAEEQGYPVTAVPASPHDVTEVAPGYIVSSSQPMVLMSVLPQDGGSPDHPVVIGSGANADPRFIHSVEWPRKGKDKFMLVGGESVLGPVGNGGGPCNDTVAAFMTWDASKAVDGKGGFLTGGSWSLVDEVRPYNGTYTDGGHPADAFGCSTHWFKPHPQFRNGGEVAVSMYEHGTRIFNVSPAGKITEVDYALPIGGATSAPHWAPDGKHFYTMDYQRGMDIWEWKGTPAPGPADADAPAGGGGGGGGDARGRALPDRRQPHRQGEVGLQGRSRLQPRVRRRRQADARQEVGEDTQAGQEGDRRREGHREGRHRPDGPLLQGRQEGRAQAAQGHQADPLRHRKGGRRTVRVGHQDGQGRLTRGAT